MRRLSVAGTGAFTQLFNSPGGCPGELMNMPITNVELLKLGLRIKASRKVLDRNQKDFSKQCGLDRSYFGGVERGERNLTFFSLCQISPVLTVTSQLSLVESLTREPLRSSRNARHLSAVNWDRPSDSSQVCVLRVPFTVVPKFAMQEPATNLHHNTEKQG